LFIKLLKYLFYIFLGYLFLGFILLPILFKPQLIKIIEKETNAKVKIESLHFNPLIFQVGVEKFSLYDLQKNKLFDFEELRINLDPTSLFMGALELKELALIDPQINLIYNKDKTINLLKVVKKKKEPQKAPESKTSMQIPRIIVDLIDIEGGKLSYKDYTKKTPFVFSLENIGFSLKNFDTKKIGYNSAGIRFYSRLGDGGFIDLKSKILSLKPFKIKGSLDFEASKLYTEWKYMQDELNLEVADGKISFSTQYSFNLADINATKIEKLHIALDRLRIKPKNKDQDILNLDTLYIANATVLPMQQSVDIQKLGLHGLHVQAKRYKNEKIDWIDYIKVNSSDINQSKQSSKPSQKSRKWYVILHNLSLEEIAVTFKDEAIRPNVTTSIDKLNIYANNITLAGKKPFDYAIEMQLNKKTVCDINGTVVHKNLDLITHLNCKDFDLLHYRPYIRKVAKQNLKRYDLSLQRAFVDLGADIEIFKNKKTFTTIVKDANLKVKKLLVRKRSTWKRLVQFKNLHIQGIKLNTANKELNVSNIVLNSLNTNLLRNKNKKLNVDGIVLAKVSKKIKKHVKKSKHKNRPYHIRVKSVALNNAKVTFVDKALPQVQKHTIDKIYVKINDIDSKRKTWLNYRASLRINKKGKVSAIGKLRHTPLQQRGSIKAKNISLVAVTPYLQQSSYLNIDDGLLSLNLKERYAPSKKGADVKIDGSLKLNSLFTTNANDNNSSLFSLNELEVKPFTLELFPNRLYIDSVLVDSFYVSAKIDENKTLNFAKLSKNSSKEQIDSDTNTTRETNTTQEPEFPITVVKVDVQNGSAEFQDFSLPIKFKTNIHDLQGIVYAVSNTPGSTTYLDVDGEVDKYGSTKLQGSVDTFKPKEYTDLNLNFKNLDLHAMSGYSASFAGYEIESGKLYLDLGYDIMYGELHATNNIMIKHIKLGRELEGDNIKHLPLGFVVGLLEDSDGIIDIDMPIEGNVNEPDFRYGALVWKTLGNLIAKAVTSPFKFLGSAMGLKGDELEYIAFEFGKSHITPPEREKLDKIVKMMNKRPKIVLQVNGTYDDVKDLEALKLQKLVAMIMKMSGDENTKHAKTALTIDMLEEVYSRLKDDDKLDKLKEELHKKYQDKEAAYKRAYQKELIGLCTEIQYVTPTELENLAQKRVQAIEEYLVHEKGLQAQRVKVGTIKKVHAEEKKEVRLKLNIEVQSTDK